MLTVNHTLDEAFDAIATYIEPFWPLATVMQAQANRVPMPHSPCVLMTPIQEVPLETPTATYLPSEFSATYSAPVRLDIQLDFYGPGSENVTSAVAAVFRTEYATNVFPEWLVPLYGGDAMQGQLTTGEQQWESRWTIVLSVQYNALVAVPQQFFDSAIVNPIPADVFYP